MVNIHLPTPELSHKVSKFVLGSLNFYRLHLLCFTFIPLIISGIFYAANGQYKIPYIDCLFMCFSCMCVTGLSPTNLSQLTTFQQFLLFVQTLLGSLIFVSLVMIYVRMYFFRAKFKHVIAEQEKHNRGFSLTRTLTAAPHALRQRFTRDPGRDEELTGTPTLAASNGSAVNGAPPKKKKGGPINKDMIKRIDGGGVGLVNPMGWYDGHTPIATPMPTPMGSTPGTNGANTPASARSRSPDHGGFTNGESHKLTTFGDLPSDVGTSPESKKRSSFDEITEENQPHLYGDQQGLTRVVTNESVAGTGTALAQPAGPIRRTPYAGTQVGEDAFPRSKTIAFDEPDDGFAHELNPGETMFGRTATMGSGNAIPWTTTMGSGGNFPRTYSLRPQNSHRVDPRYTGFGGFPTPLQLIGKVFRKTFPRASTKFNETMTMPRTNTVTGRDSIRSGMSNGQTVPYISFSAVVGRNSNFKGLTEDQMDELGGVEYRALKLLFWIVLCYWIFLPLAGATIIAPYIAASRRWREVFTEQEHLQHREVRIPWFAFFQAYSGFTNLGMSLVDLSVLPFQKAYLMNFVVAMLILFGNTCYPILLRLIIWAMWRTVPADSSTSESLKFLLDHPRRCFVYLFPSTTTWFLTLVVLLLTCIDFLTFMILDIGTPAIEDIAVGARIAAGLFQSVAVRAAGFAIVPMNSLAPAVKVMFVIMMYISVYPIAMSVRSTNVYEEKALGLFDEDEDEDDLEEEEEAIGKQTGANAVAKYLGFHARRQLAFDMWWIVGALWLVTIIERPSLNDKAKWEYMNIFNIIFELVSAYGTVGLSLGVTYDNFSLVGGMRKLSKLVIIIVMLRGRHRGLPVAIDRAVMLPKELEQAEEAAIGDRLRRMRSRMSMSQASGEQGMPRTWTNATNATFQPGSNDEAWVRGRAQSVSTSPKMEPTRRDSSVGPRPLRKNSAPEFPSAPGIRLNTTQEVTASAPRRGRRDSSPSVSIATGAVARDRSPSATRGDGIRRHQRSMSSGASSMESPVATPAALTLALSRLQQAQGAAGSESSPPVANRLTTLPGLSPLHESEYSRRGTVAEPEQMDEPTPDAAPRRSVTE